MSNEAIDRVTPEDLQTGFRSSVMAADACSSTRVDLAQLWKDLTTGAVVAVDVFCDGERCYIVLIETNAPCRRPPVLGQRNIEILRRTLLGEAQKVLAIELGLSASSVATAGAHALKAMGVDCTPTRIPLLIVMAAHAYYGQTVPIFARQSLLFEGAKRYRVLSAARPDPAAINSLSDAERSVVRLVLERCSNAEIARIRSTSARTVANQLSTVLHKLKVNARSGILCRLIAAARGSIDTPQEGWPEAANSPSGNAPEAYTHTSRIELPDSYAGLGRSFADCNRVQFPQSTRTG